MYVHMKKIGLLKSETLDLDKKINYGQSKH